MSKIHFTIPIPTFIENIIVYFLLRYRKKHYGFAFRRIKLITDKDVDIKYQYAFVDASDYQNLSQYPWQLWGTESNKGYAIRYSGKKIIYMHRQIMNAPKGKIVDHKDRDGLNNTKQNLRFATRSQNNCNSRQKKGSSKYRGVSREKETGKWKCKINFNRICMYLGVFEAEEDAARAYDEAAKIYHGEFAVLNFPDEIAEAASHRAGGANQTGQFWGCLFKKKIYNYVNRYQYGLLFEGRRKMKPVRDEMNEVKKTDEIRVLLTNRSLPIRDGSQFRFLPPVSNGLKKVIAISMILAVMAAFVTAKEKEAKAAQEPNGTIMQKQAAGKAGLPLEKAIELGNEVNMVVVFIPAGEFDMGSPPEELKRDDDEAQHHIKLTKAFYIGKFEVTQLQYRVIMSENPSKFGGDKLPVENVSWYEAARFLKKLSDKTNLKFRLPTEAEWEYACRAGTTTAFNTGTTLDSDFANYDAGKPYANGIIGKYLDRTTPVGSYPPNAFGLYDMHGNVWEWCNDIYDEDYYKVTPLVDPQGPQKAEGGDRAARGGAWNEYAYKCRSADRNNYSPKADKSYIGFRVVMDIEK